MEIKAPKTTTHPQPPSGGGYSGAAVAGGIFDICLFSNYAEKEKKTQGFKQLALFCFVLFSFWKTAVFNHHLQALERILRAETNFQLSWGHRTRVPVFKSKICSAKKAEAEYLQYPIQYVTTVTNY